MLKAADTLYINYNYKSITLMSFGFDLKVKNHLFDTILTNNKMLNRLNRTKRILLPLN